MARKTFGYWLTVVAYVILCLNLLFVLFSRENVIIHDLKTLVLFTGWALTSSICAITWLLLYYRRLFQLWRYWFVILAVVGISGAVETGALSVRNAGVQTFFSLLYIFSLYAMALATILVFYYNDVGLGVAGWGLSY